MPSPEKYSEIFKSALNIGDDKLNENYKNLYNFNEDLKKLPLNTGIRSKIFNIGNILKQLYL